MSDRHVGFLVTLEGPIKDDDADQLRKAIAMIRGVVDVQPIVDDIDKQLARSSARTELIHRLWDVLK